MAIAEVIKMDPAHVKDVVWKFPVEDFNTTSQLIVDETHEALLVINGNAADLFGPGRRTLSTSNIPLLSKIVNIPTGGVSPFPCKVFFINQVHQMDLKWGTQSPIPLEDPLYDIFMHVMVHGSMSISMADSRKFLLKLVGFQSSFSAEALVAKFRGLISSHVKDCISKIMIDGKLSYFMISSNLLEISQTVKERLDAIFDEYGVAIEFFNIEAVEVPRDDYNAIAESKKRRTSRLIEGYSWREEREMLIAEKMAENPGIGATGGMVGAMAGGMAMGNTIGEIARNALNGVLTPVQQPSPAPAAQPVSAPTPQPVIAQTVVSQPAAPQPAAPAQTGQRFCPECGAEVGASAKFCSSCGHRLAPAVCPGCGNPITPGAKFCAECGTRLG